MADDDVASDFDTVLRAFKAFNGFTGPGSSGLWWRTDGAYEPVTLFVICNDVFIWGCSDSVCVGPHNISDLEKAVDDCRAVSKAAARFADVLFCARQAGMRPQGAFYKYLPEEMHALLNACGPEREVGLGNPEPQPPAPEQGGG